MDASSWNVRNYPGKKKEGLYDFFDTDRWCTYDLLPIIEYIGTKIPIN